MSNYTTISHLKRIADELGVELQIRKVGRTWSAEIWDGEHCTVSAHYHTRPDKKFWSMVAEDLETIARETRGFAGGYVNAAR